MLERPWFTGSGLLCYFVRWKRRSRRGSFPQRWNAHGEHSRRCSLLLSCFPVQGDALLSQPVQGAAGELLLFLVAQCSVPKKGTAPCTVELMDWEREAASSRLGTQNKQNPCLGHCLTITTLVNLKCVHKICLVLPCLQLQHMTQFKKWLFLQNSDFYTLSGLCTSLCVQD